MVYCFSNLELNQEFLFPIKDVFTISLFEVTIFYTTAMVEDVGLEPLLMTPNHVCYQYTTSSIYGISYWDSNPYLAVLETAVLPIKLRILVELVGIEPTIFCLQSNCAPITLQSQIELYVSSILPKMVFISSFSEKNSRYCGGKGWS